MSPASPDPLLHRLLARLVGLRRGEATPAALSFAYFFALLAGYYMIRPIRDSLGLAGGVRQLPWLMSGTFAAMALASPLFAFLVARVPRRRLVPLVYRIFLACLLAFWALLHFNVAPLATARAFYIFTSVYNLFVVSVFWSFMADVWRAEQGRRLFGLIAAGGSVGAVVGPLLTSELVGGLGEANLLLVSALWLELAARLATILGRRAANTTDNQGTGGSLITGLTAIGRDPFLAAIAAQTILFTFLSTFLYLQQNTVVEAALAERAARTQFFARVDLAVNVLSLLAQAALFGQIAIRRAGVALALALVPALSLIGFSALALWPSLFLVGLFSVVRRAGHYAIERPARELLFTAVSREARYKAKNFTDTVIYRGGDMTSGWLYNALAAALPAMGTSLAALPLCLGGLFLARPLARRFHQHSAATAASTPGDSHETLAS